MTGAAALTRDRLASALSEVTTAENALELALQELRGGARAEKITMSAALETAFARVRAARAELARLREMLEND